MNLARQTALLALLAAPAAAQSFVKNVTDIPQASSRTEQIDFADVDLDGDWDAALANGEVPSIPKQNQLWINQGHLQGGPVGLFLDETSLRLPVLLNQSRDIEFADIDGDADHDLYVPADGMTADSGARWWVNQGGEQGGVVGFYADETAVRWIGLGLPGSSIPPAQLLPSGTFYDWSNDGDFADLDNDGDLDLVHSSYGKSFGGKAPTRVFLNDGDGHFKEFNPSGFMLPGTDISDGNPALWCDGLQQYGTFDTTGAFANIAATVIGFELGDTDGDFDVDIVLTGRGEPRPRFFRNHLEQGPLSFRDESGLAFPGITLGGATFEQELGDLDDDGDLDLYGLSWAASGFSLPDVTLTNNGGVFGNQTILPDSGQDEEEGDFLDYDNDGDLDLFVANFTGQELLYENQGGAPITYLNVTDAELPQNNSTSHDGEVADVDEDGDYDVFVANGANQKIEFFENVTGVPDVTRPRIPGLEALAAAAAGPGVRPVRARVLDDAGYYTVWYYDVLLETKVDGIALPALPLRNSGGAIFRGELPANLVGQVAYLVRATDFYGNSGVSATKTYAASGDAGTSYGVASAPSGAPAPALRALSEAIAGETLYLAGQGIPGAPGFLGVSLASLPPLAVPGLPNLILNIDPGPLLVASEAGVIGFAGDLVFPLAIPPGTAGATIYAQFLDLGGDGTFGSSLGLSLTIH
jgi:hypothetical protein